MIDLDGLDRQLDQARTPERPRPTLERPRRILRSAAPPAAPARPAPAPSPPPPSPPMSPPARPSAGTRLFRWVRRVVRATAALRPAPSPPPVRAVAPPVPSQTATDRLRAPRSVDPAAEATMAALLEGRQDDSLDGLRELQAAARRAKAPELWDHWWAQRYWFALQWGDADERGEVLDHCRERAYCHDDLGWRAALTLLLARTGRREEAEREFDVTAARGLDGKAWEGDRLDVATHLAEAAALLGDPGRAGVVHRWLSAVPLPPVVNVPRGPVCKGSVARYWALVAATMGRWEEADAAFADAAEAHRALGARPLLARTLDEWGCRLVGRDDARARACLDASAAVTRDLELTDLSEYEEDEVPALTAG